MEAAAVAAPHDLLAEREILGSLIFGATTADVIAGRLPAAAFHDPKHRLIYEAILGLAQQSRSVDMTTVHGELRRLDRLDQAGGASYLGNLQELMGVNLDDYVTQVLDAHQLRRLAAAGRKIAGEALAARRPAQDVLEDAERAILEIGAAREDGGLAKLAEILKPTWTLLEEASRSGTGITGLATGYSDLDHMTTGLHPGELIVIAGRPSMGKTALGVNVAHNVARAGGKVAIFSLEMPRAQLMQRLLSSEARVNLMRLRSGKLDAEHWQRLVAASELFYQDTIWIDDTPAATAVQLRGKCRRHKAKFGLDLVVVDYLQQMRGPGDNETQIVSGIARELKTLARQLEVPLIALCQLNRAVELRDDKRPRLSDIRESGQVEQEADLVLFPFRPEVYTPDDLSIRKQAELLVAKQRNGPLGTVKMIFERSYTRFESAPRSEYAGI